jgi:hypothetical protein
MVLNEFEESLRQAAKSQTGGSIRVIWISQGQSLYGPCDAPPEAP